MGDAAEKLYDEAMKLPPSDRRTFALRVLASLGEGDETTELVGKKGLRGIAGIGSDQEASGETHDRFLYGFGPR